MKKLFLIIIIPFLISCNGIKQERFTPGDIKYITRNLKDLSTYIKDNLPEKDGIHIIYPEYIEESYSLIKYVAFITNEFGMEGIFIEDLPHIKSLEESVPELNHSGFIDLYNFCKEHKISFTNNLTSKDKIIVLSGSPEEFNLNRNKTKGYLTIVLAGTRDTYKFRDMINNIPIGKSIGVVPLKNWRFPGLNSLYDSVVFLGDINSYTPVKTFNPYDFDNYTKAPEYFLNKNKGITEGSTIKKMNRFLYKEVYKTNRYLNLKEIEKDE